MAKFYSDSIVYTNPSPYNINVKKKNWIMQPAIAYKVLVPYPADKELNFFQETILELFRGGNKHVEFLAEKLLLKPELIEFIIKELKIKKYLSENNLVTEEGQNALENNIDDYDLKVGYIFYDFLKKDFWDVFIFENEYREYEKLYQNKNTLGIDIGTAGRPYKINGFCLESEIIEPELKPERILEVCKKSKKRKKRKMNNLYSEKEVIKLPKNISKVEYSGESKKVWIANYIFFQENDYWQVCHPFGGISQVLREKLDKEKDNNQELKDLISNLNNENLRVSKFDENKEIKDDVKSYVKKLLTENISKYEEVYFKICQVTLMYNKLFNSNKSGADIETLELLKVEYIRKLYDILEDSLYSTMERFDNYYNINYLESQIFSNIKILGELAIQMGFENNDKLDIFTKMFNVKKGQLTHIRESKELKALIAINLLIAKEFNEHPFWTIGKKYSKILLFLYKLKLNRDETSHGEINIFYSEEELKLLYNKSLYLVSSLLEDLKLNISEKMDLNEEILSDKRIYLLAENEVENEIGIEIRKDEELKKLLIHFNISEESSDYIVKAVKIFEYSCSLIWNKLKNKDINHIIKRDMKSNLEILNNELGIRIDELPDSFKNINVDKIYKTINNYEKGVLSTRIYCILFAIKNEENKIYRDFILDNLYKITNINDLRGHGNNIDVEKYDSSKIKEEVFNIVKALLNIFKNTGKGD